ncbi:helix-turn-helix transcriptional regulator [Novosphingobium album (ex Liu et al. 2023)]|uniref:AraC family transcriptional regulator n=1 Tax=Novosphingobium album (ex Liu et al. 2023) TaxID=3031130 RepID=A0ABT5WLQ0_9SPHN|nr:AraC family transcriptional regulator [Novosphingobium album (ex Liu et al. 2023)]MDE8650977.1 AraC family transcriptional regulator [Novosphingobium album (ex Liu et al. 2023)]
MTEIIFQFDRRNFADCQRHFRGQDRDEYYEGEYAIDAAEAIEVIADKAPIGASSIIRLRSRSRLTFRRTPRHIREDGIDLAVLWFVRRGAIRISAAGGEHRIAGAGDFLLTRSARPFFMECLADGDQRHEVIHLTVPTHIARAFIPDSVPCGFIAKAAAGRVAVVRRILEEIHGAEEPISPDSGHRLLEAALSLVGEIVTEPSESVAEKLTIAQRRIQGVLRFIEIHLCNPDLNTAMVCRGCGISPRYLSSLLQMHGTSFRTLVWGQRMAKAREWLASSAASEVPVSEVAHALGFKSAAHFSRRFKRVYRFNPSTCRAPRRDGSLAEEGVEILGRHGE